MVKRGRREWSREGEENGQEREGKKRREKEREENEWTKREEQIEIVMGDERKKNK